MTEPTLRRLFVAGATGAVGKKLLERCDSRRVRVQAHVRPKSASQLEGRSDLVTMELNDPHLATAVADSTTVVQLIGTMRKRFASGDTYQTSDIGTTQTLVSAAKACGTVDHFILLSSVGAGAPRGAYLRAKAEAERIVVTSGLPHTIFRPSAFEDREGVFVPGLGALTRMLGLTKYRPIKLHQLASAILVCAQERKPFGIVEGDSLWELVKRAGE